MSYISGPLHITFYEKAREVTQWIVVHVMHVESLNSIFYILWFPEHHQELPLSTKSRVAQAIPDVTQTQKSRAFS